MKKVFIGVLLLLSFFILFYHMINYAKNNKKIKSSGRSQQIPSRPILPPVVPSPLPSISPTPSLSISAPNTMSAQKINTGIQFRRPQANIPNLPKLPELPQSTNVAKSVLSAPILPQKIQLIKSLLGTIIKIGEKENKILWLAVKDRFSGETIRINVDSEKTRVMRKDIAAFALENIKIGDMVRVIFNQAGKERPVNVISIINEEDLKPNAQPKKQ